MGIVALALLSQPKSLQADGGTLRAANVPMGAYRISVYTDPTPIPPDTIDISVLATFERGRGLAPGLEIEVTARRLDGVGPVIRPSGHEAAGGGSPLLRGEVRLGIGGRLGGITVRVQGSEGEGDVLLHGFGSGTGPLQQSLPHYRLRPLTLLFWSAGG